MLGKFCGMIVIACQRHNFPVSPSFCFKIGYMKFTSFLCTVEGKTSV